MAEPALDPNEKPHEQLQPVEAHLTEEKATGTTGGETLDHHHEQQTQPNEQESPVVVAAATGEDSPVAPRDGPALQPAPAVAPSAVEETRPVIGASRRVRTIEPTSGVDLRIAQSGLAAENPITVPTMMRNSVSKTPDRAALCYKDEGNWKSISYTEYYRLCVAAAKAFLKLGLEPFHGVGILGFNSPEWLISNLGAIFAGGIAAGVYTTNSPEACQFIAHDCKANIIVVENQKQLDKILQVRDQLPHLKAIVQYKGKLSQQYPNVLEWDQFMELGKDVDDSVIEEMIKAQRPDQCALLVYTSGTTGNPKGVMLSHDNLTWTCKSICETCKELSIGEHTIVSYLPLSHIAAQLLDVYTSIYKSITIYFADPDALKGSLVNTLKEVKPTGFLGVPRVYEKIKERMEESAAGISGLKKTLVRWAKEKGLAGNRNREQNLPLPWGWWFANKLVFKNVREALGFSNCRIFMSGAAPINKEVVEFFMCLNIPILEVYGMSESSGPHTINVFSPGGWKLGSAGRVIEGCELKIGSPDSNGDGEVLFRGRHVFMGYLNSEEKTVEAIDDEGWLHSGDVGRVDKDGFLFITGRIKELLITSGGENIPPIIIEDCIKKELPFLSNVMVIGDRRKFLACVVTIKVEVNPESGEPTDVLTPHARRTIEQIGSQCTKVSEIIETKDAAIFKAIQDGLDRANKHATSNAQAVQKWHLLPVDFSVIGDELGPTLKLKRRIVLQKYADVIDAMYA